MTMPVSTLIAAAQAKAGDVAGAKATAEFISSRFAAQPTFYAA